MHGLIIREVTEIQLHPINMNREDGLVFGKPLNHSLKEQKKILMRIQNNSIMALFRAKSSDSPSTLPSSVGCPSSVS
jgi:hypothetical protein